MDRLRKGLEMLKLPSKLNKCWQDLALSTSWHCRRNWLSTKVASMNSPLLQIVYHFHHRFLWILKLNLFSKIWTVYLWINMVKYDVDWEITNGLITVFHPFANICLYSVKFETIWLISIWIDLFDKIWIGFWSLLNIW